MAYKLLVTDCTRLQFAANRIGSAMEPQRDLGHPIREQSYQGFNFELRPKVGDSGAQEFISGRAAKVQGSQRAGGPGYPYAKTRTVPRDDGESLRMLEYLLDYEIRVSGRYRRFATLIIVGSEDSATDIVDLLIGHIRASDEIFDLDSTAAIVMSDTDSSDALVAVRRYKSRCSNGVDLRFGIASYPSDARDSGELLSTAHRRLGEARNRQYGAVVFSG